jgi:hypothetical protein
MADQWFYSHDDHKIGPVSCRQLKELATSGILLRTDTVWKEGVDLGVTATKVRYLFATAVVVVSAPLPPYAPEPELAAVEPSIREPVAGADTTVAIVSIPVALDFAKSVEPDLPREVPAPIEPVSPPPVPRHVPKARARAGIGSVIVSQDGTYVRFRKSCTTCGHNETSISSMRIVTGMARLSFYCNKCRKLRNVTIQGTVS